MHSLDFGILIHDILESIYYYLFIIYYYLFNV